MLTVDVGSLFLFKWHKSNPNPRILPFLLTPQFNSPFPLKYARFFVIHGQCAPFIMRLIWETWEEGEGGALRLRFGYNDGHWHWARGLEWGIHINK